MKVRLETTKGELVATGRIPPFKIWPDVIFWGTRTFKLVAAGNLAAVGLYGECFAVHMLEVEDPNQAPLFEADAG